MSHSVVVQFPLKFVQTLKERNLKNEIKWLMEEDDEMTDFSEANLNKLIMEVKEGPSSKHLNEHLKIHYKDILIAILKNSQIDEYFDVSYEPILKKHNVIEFKMEFPNFYDNEEIEEIILEGLEITHMNMSDTLLKWEPKLFIIYSNFLPVFELGYFDMNLNEINFKF